MKLPARTWQMSVRNSYNKQVTSEFSGVSGDFLGQKWLN